MKRTELQWWDAVVLSVLLFGGAIWNSTAVFFTSDLEILAQGTEFTAADNWFGLATILVELGLGYLYLKLRRFDFSRWHYQITAKGTLAAVGLYLMISVGMDAVFILTEGWTEATAYVGQWGILYVLAGLDVSVIVFSLLNGVYEEIFFLGVCTAVPEKQRWTVFLYSLFIRFSFHTYQGLPSALGIGLVIGCIYYFCYCRGKRNLYPYMLSHSLADIFGAGILYLL